MVGDGVFEDGGIVGDVVAFGAEGQDVDPGVAGGQRGDIGGDGGGQGGEGNDLGSGFDFGQGGDVGHVHAVAEFFDVVDLADARDLLAALAERGQHGDILTYDILHIDLGAWIGFVADDDRGAGDVFQPAVLEPKFFPAVFVNGYGGGDVLNSTAKVHSF